MTKLADMEELLASISNKDMVDYMREAMTCYGAGAYRGCIVMSYLALFDDLKFKLEELARINGVAKNIHLEVEKRSGNQEVFESYMADQLQKAGLLTKAEHKQLELIRDIRNRAAHPSGVHAKPEEARYVYRVVIDDFLSRQLLKTTHAADAVLERLTKSNLFPGTNFGEIVEVTKAEVATINPAAYAYFINKLVAAKGDSSMERNAERMLAAMTCIDDPVSLSLIRKALLEGKSHDPDYTRWIARVVSANGSTLKGLQPSAVLRVRAMLTKDIAKPSTASVTGLIHPATRLASMISGLGEDEILENYKPFAEAVINRFPYASPILYEIAEAPSLRGILVDTWIENAQSSTWDTANAFALAAPDLDDYAKELLSEEEALRLIIAVVQAAEWSARRSKNLRSEQFASIPNIREMAIQHTKKKPRGSANLVKKVWPDSTLRDFLGKELGEN
jgi:hypothetical protein